MDGRRSSIMNYRQATRYSIPRKTDLTTKIEQVETFIKREYDSRMENNYQIQLAEALNS